MKDCEMPIERLVAYAEGQLRGARQELVEAHVEVCASCQARLAAFEYTDQIMARSRKWVDDPAQRAEIMRGVAQLAWRQQQRSLPRWDRITSQPWFSHAHPVRAVTVMVLVLITVVVASSPRLVEAAAEIEHAVEHALIDLVEEVSN